MTVLLSAWIDEVASWAHLKFPYNKTVIERLKELPGARWEPVRKEWVAPLDLFEAVICKDPLFRINITAKTPWKPAPYLDPPKPHVLRPFQGGGAKFLLSRPIAALNWDMRTGKTPTALTAGRSSLLSGIVNAIVVVYPASVQGEWVKQTKDWAKLPFMALEGLSKKQAIRIPKGPFFLGVHYEIFRDWVGRPEAEVDESGAVTINAAPGLLWEILDGKTYGVIFDEVQYIQNRKAGRAEAAAALAKKAKFRWALTGTIMRNRAKNLFHIFQTLNPGSAGRGFSKFGIRYCDYHVGDDGHWDDSGISNPEELRARLAVFVDRKTRNDVAAELPKSQRSIIYTYLGTKERREYKKLESSFAHLIGNAITDSDSLPVGSAKALESLVEFTTESKLPVLAERVEHYLTSGHKLVVFNHLHATTDAVVEILEKEGHPFFVADGRVEKKKRRGVIAEWKKAGGVLVAGTLAAGIGIDLSDATAAIFTELEWVPADFRQAEDRIVDVHQGKRVSPPIYEYLIAKDTIDEAMIRALISKIADIERVVGGDKETAHLKGTIGEAVGAGVALDSHAAVRAALIAMRDRVLGKSDHAQEEDRASLAAKLAAEWGDEDAEGVGDSEEEG